MWTLVAWGPDSLHWFNSNVTLHCLSNVYFHVYSCDTLTKGLPTSSELSIAWIMVTPTPWSHPHHACTHSMITPTPWPHPHHIHTHSMHGVGVDMVWVWPWSGCDHGHGHTHTMPTWSHQFSSLEDHTLER